MSNYHGAFTVHKGIVVARNEGCVELRKVMHESTTQISSYEKK
jgi:hypothetical protein